MACSRSRLTPTRLELLLKQMLADVLIWQHAQRASRIFLVAGLRAGRTSLDLAVVGAVPPRPVIHLRVAVLALAGVLRLGQRDMAAGMGSFQFSPQSLHHLVRRSWERIKPADLGIVQVGCRRAIHLGIGHGSSPEGASRGAVSPSIAPASDTSIRTAHYRGGRIAEDG
jgi:hypothetical protein